MKQFWFVIALNIFISPAVRADTAKPIWSGTSGGITFLWTTDDIRVTPESDPANILYSAKREFQKDFGRDAPKKGYVFQYIRIVSLVGPLMSMERYTEGFNQGAAHPFNISRFTTVDMRHPDRKATITDYFNAKVIYKALLQDKIVRSRLKGDIPAATLGELIEQLREHNLDSEQCEYGFEPDILTRFAFYDIQGNKVAVRLGLNDIFGSCRGSLAQIGIWLPIPGSLRQDFDHAAAQTSGFLMKGRGFTKPIVNSYLNASKTFLQTVTHFEAGDIAHIQDYM